MNSILKALLGTNKPNIIKPEIIEIKRKAPRTPKIANKDIKKSEDAITEKEIQVAMKRIKKVEAEARKRIAEEELKNHNSAKSAAPKSTVKSGALKSTAPKKQPIPNHVKTLLWNHWVGCDKAETYCLCCKVTKISIRSFHAGHIIAESKGGDMTVKNLKPICGPCNLSMGSTNMDEFIKKFGLGK